MGFVRAVGLFTVVLISGVVMAADGQSEPKAAQPPKIVFSKPDGWHLLTDKQEHLFGETYFRTLTSAYCPTLTVVIVTTAEGMSVNQMAENIMRLSVSDGLIAVESEKAIDGRTLATGLAAGKLKDGRMHSVRFGVRSPKTRPDLLVVVNATWTGNLTPRVREELDFIILTATAE